MDFPPPGWERGGISENGQNSYSSGVPENIHSEFKVNRTIFQDGGYWGERFPPPGGKGGEFRKKRNRTLTQVMRQRTYIPSFKTNSVNFEILEFRGESITLPGGGGMGGNFGKLKNAFVK